MEITHTSTLAELIAYLNQQVISDGIQSVTLHYAYNAVVPDNSNQPGTPTSDKKTSATPTSNNQSAPKANQLPGTGENQNLVVSYSILGFILIVGGIILSIRRFKINKN